jgi:putative ABC transport system permease protein
MATYTTEMRIQEIGIRKVLGASVSNVTYLLVKDYIKMILFSAVFAIPGGYFITDAIMENFAFRPALTLWVLPAALIFILVLALITIGSQTVKAAVANPVDSIHYE